MLSFWQPIPSGYLEVHSCLHRLYYLSSCKITVYVQLKIHQPQPNIYTSVESRLRPLSWCDSWSSHQDSEELSTSFFWWRSRDEIDTSK